MEDFIGKYDGNQIDSRLDKVKDMVGATASEAGAAGLVPAPAAGKHTSFLRGDGTWQDIAVHEPGFLSDNFDDENDFRSILFSLAFGGISSLTQSQYNIIASKCEVDTTTQYLLSGSSSTYGIGDVVLMRASSGDMQCALRTGCKLNSEYICYYADVFISKDLTCTSVVSQYAVKQADNQTKDIIVSISSLSGDNRTINFSTAGSGAKALMDDGTYKEVQVRSDVEDAFLAIILQLVEDESTTLPQSQYNTIKSLFDGSSTSNVRMIRPNNSFVEALGGVNINDLMVFNDQMNDCITIYISASNNTLNMGFLDISISVYPNLSVEYTHSNLNIASSDNSEIVIVNAYRSTADDIDFDNQLHLKLKGTGNKALMDNGLYQDIRGVDISSYLLEPGTFNIVSSITKSKYDDIKSYILNNDHMYLSMVISDSGFTAAFNSDIIASYIYDAAYLVFFDPNSSKMSKIKINYDTYEVSTIEF